ncbi:Gp6 [Phodopus roborovskii]|uniref:Gp6 protein n=1 Tax=Phodopus roborovskii TaxID=109678 RepID=A0AAV0ACC7_PHORO|nr:Gp6 [Phodopus roborovskii]
MFIYICIWLCVLQVILARSGPFPKPSLRAQPSSLVPLEQPVTLRCQGPPAVDLYRLEKLKSEEYEDQDFLFIPTMKTSNAGRYRCSYQMGSHWSPASDQLELIATGVYDKPSLSAHPSSVVPPGGDVTLQCRTRNGFDQFVLYKEGDTESHKKPERWYRADTEPYKNPERWYRADFPITTVAATHSGIYRCYSFSSSSPYLWSAPSDSLVLVVTGPTATPSQKPSRGPSNLLSTKIPTTEKAMNTTASLEGSSPPIGFSHQHYARGNLVRICLGAMIIIFLVGLLAEDWHSRKKHLPQRIRAVQRPLPPLPRA